ncbi:MAG: saccharopine dehydrogenase NADP-binding domain-containing protein [Pirellulales bacterium]|nr:saccharopine dehydrogenase NADP-binding domain-containing protein [Pirellulales bacterium]
MYPVLLLGCGKIGQAIACLLARTGDYRLRIADVSAEPLARLRKTIDVQTVQLDASSAGDVADAARGCRGIVSALSYHHNPLVARVALEAGASYFDLTEDVETAHQVRRIASQAAPGQIFMPQCGLAPGFIGILGYHLTKSFDMLDAVHMRVGALPRYPSNALNYNLTWSTDGLINEYCNPCEAIHAGRRVTTLPLEGLECFSLDGVCYEAFNTSGGLGTLCETLEGRVRELNYRTIRYVGHRDLMAFLISDLRLGDRREMLKDILELAIPVTFQDVVVIFANVTGWRSGQFVQASDARKIYQQTVDGQSWSAIQITTAAGISAALDLWIEGKLPDSGLVRQEDVKLDDFLENRFGRYYRSCEPADGRRAANDLSGGADACPTSRDPRPANPAA